jgi:hypothetical protein
MQQYAAHASEAISLSSNNVEMRLLFRLMKDGHAPCDGSQTGDLMLS